MPSRAADDCFWLGRDIERLGRRRPARSGRAAPAGARAPAAARDGRADVLAACLSRAGLADAGSATAIEVACRALSQAAAWRGRWRRRRGCSGLRDRLTDEAHAALAQAIRSVRNPAPAAWTDLVDAMTGLQRLAITQAGIAADGCCKRAAGISGAGRRLERAAMTATTLATVLDQKQDRVRERAAPRARTVRQQPDLSQPLLRPLQPRRCWTWCSPTVNPGGWPSNTRGRILLQEAGIPGLAERAQELQQHAAGWSSVDRPTTRARAATFVPRCCSASRN